MEIQRVERRIKRFKEIAERYGLKDTTVKYMESLGQYVASIKGNTFKIKNYKHFEERCKELKDYQPPQPINLTNRLIKIEEMALKTHRK